MNLAVGRGRFTGKQLLWIDDRVSIHSNLIGQFEARGVLVHAVTTIADAVESLKKIVFDSVLLDVMLGHESSLLMPRNIISKFKGIRLHICSGFMYQEELQKQRRNAEKLIKAPIGKIEKLDLPSPDQSDMIDKLLEQVFFDEARVETESLTIETETALSLSFADYKQFSFQDRLQWIERSRPFITKVADEYFDKGYVYLLFCGSDEKPVLSYLDVDDIPTNEEILRYSESLGYAPLSFHNIGTVDDVSSNCCKTSGLQSYPTLKISALEGEFEEVHFDSGAQSSLMSYEWYAEKGWISLIESPSLIRFGEMTQPGSLITLKQCSFIDSVGKSIKADFRAYYIINWAATRLAVNCGSGCINPGRSVNGRNGTCRFRTGLLGRSLPKDELKVQFSIDFTSGNVSFLK